MNFYSDESEWKWMFKNAIDWDKIIPLYYPSFPTEDGFETKEEVLQFLEELMTHTGEWAGGDLAKSKAEALDRDGIGTLKDGETIVGEVMTDTYKQATELGIFGLCLPKKFGGMEAPATLHLMILAQGARACVSTTTQMAFFTSIAEMLHRFGDKEDQDRLIPQIIAGEISGSMCLTEPGCGSDLGNTKTSATLREDGKYLLNGTKCFITNGGGGIGLILARIKGAPEGLAGISLFLAEQKIPEKDGLNFRVTKNEDKMGMHGSFTTEVVYENTISKLIGEPNQGFKMMLHLMNEARVAVSMQALGITEAALAFAREYAEEREAFGMPIAQLPLMKRNLSDFETERDAIRALMADTTSHFDIFNALDLKEKTTNDLTNEEKEMLEDAKMWTRKRTPLIKYYTTETCTTLTSRAIQVLGGYGYMKEYPVERYHRDSYGPLLYEGTSQIQALMALKDLVKYAMKDPKGFFTKIIDKHPSMNMIGGEEWTKVYKSSHYKFKKRMVRLLVKCLRPNETTKILDLKAWTDIENINELMVHAETLCQAMAYMETLRVLCDHANKDDSRAELFFKYHRLVTPRLEGIYTDWSMD